MGRLIVSVVVHCSPLPVLTQTLTRLQEAGRRAVAAEAVSAVKVVVVDNGSAGDYGAELAALIGRLEAAGMAVDLLPRSSNGGYAQGHNEVATSGGDFRLILNPDVFLEPDSLIRGLAYLRRQPQTGVVVPRVVDDQGRPAYLCKRYPSVSVLGLRGFAPARLKRRFAKYLADYEMRDLDWNRPRTDLEVVSGCCLLMHGRVWQETGGFCPDYFLYFEDFDFALRARERMQIAYVPDFRVTHLGGDAARKGWHHRIWFVQSGWRFFNRHGWRWV